MQLNQPADICAGKQVSACHQGDAAAGCCARVQRRGSGVLVQIRPIDECRRCKCPGGVAAPGQRPGRKLWMHQEHGVCGLDEPYVKNFGSGIWRGNLKDRISRAAAAISRKACAIDIVPKQVLQLEGVGRFVCDLVVATVELRHAGDARHKNLCAIRQAMSCGCDDDRIGLGCSADGLCGIEDLSTVAVDTHHTIAKLEDVGVACLELERHQARLDCAVLDLA